MELRGEELPCHYSVLKGVTTGILCGLPPVWSLPTTGKTSFIVLRFILHGCVLYKLKVFGSPALSKYISAISTTVSSDGWHCLAIIQFLRYVHFFLDNAAAHLRYSVNTGTGKTKKNCVTHFIGVVWN